MADDLIDIFEGMLINDKYDLALDFYLCHLYNKKPDTYDAEFVLSNYISNILKEFNINSDYDYFYKITVLSDICAILSDTPYQNCLDDIKHDIIVLMQRG